MGWALTYSIRLKRPLTTDEQAALDRWSREQELPAEILLSDDYHLSNARPSEVELSGTPSARPDSDDVAAALERAKREFERWKRSKS
jgi:hypothetical protein